MSREAVHKWVYPTDRELFLRAKVNNGLGWSFKSINSDLRSPASGGFSKQEIEKIEEVIQCHKDLMKEEEERIGKMMKKFENMKTTQGDGTNTCSFCDASFGLFKAKPYCCHLCKRSVCGKCKIETEKRQIVLQKILCRICSEYREIWKKTNAWFFGDIPKYVIPPDPAKPVEHNSPVINKNIDRRNDSKGEGFCEVDDSDSSNSLSTTDSDDETTTTAESSDEENKEKEETSSEGSDLGEDQVLDNIIGPQDLINQEECDDLETGEFGAIKFSLQYDPIEQMLNINVFSGHKLKSMDVGGTSDPYVKCNLVPGHPKATKLKTMRKECDLNPVFNEKLTYHGIFDSDINSKMLRLTVLDYDRMTTNDIIGITTVPLAGLVPQQQHFYREVLKEPIELEREENNILSDRGRIQVSLHYQAKKELKVAIVRCSMLIAPGSDCLPNPMVKVNIKPSSKKNAFKNKTEVVKKTANPEFGPKATFSYDISDFDIENPDKCLEVSVWDCTGLKRHSYIGGVVLGKEVGGSGSAHWTDALQSSGYRIKRWHRLEGEEGRCVGDNSSIEMTEGTSQIQSVT